MFARTSTSKHIVAVADVGSGSAGVALLAVHAGAPATVIAASRVVLPYEERNDEAIVKGIIAALAEASEKARSAYMATPYASVAVPAVYAVIRAPWTRSKTERATSTMESDTRITSGMIASLAQQAIANDKELDRERLFESSVVRVELNGYVTASPVGKVARSLSVVALLSDCEAPMRAGVDEVLRRLFPGAKPILRSGARALISAAGGLSGMDKDYVILDIEGEASAIIVVREGLASEHLVIPEGVASIVKRISDKGLPEETLSLMRMMERDESASDATNSLSASVARVEIDLARVYGEGLTKIASVQRLPPDLILITHPDLSPWLKTFFSRIDFSQCTLTAQPFDVRTLESSDFRDKITLNGSVTADIGLIIASALVNSEANS